MFSRISMKKAKTFDQFPATTFRMEPNVWRDFPRDLFMNVAVLLPLKSLLKFRTISRRWNIIPLDPHFQTIRSSFHLELIEASRSCVKFRNGRWLPCAGGFLISVDNCRELYVLHTANVSLTQVPVEDFCPHADKRYFAYTIHHLLIDQDTKSYSFFVSVREKYESVAGALSNADYCARLLSRTLYRYDSVTRSWSYSGDMSERTSLSSFARYPGGYLLLVGCARKEGSRPYIVRRYRQDKSLWEVLPGKCPPCEKITPFLFDHGNRVFLAVFSSDTCSFWEYQHNTSEWILDHVLPITCFDNWSLEKRHGSNVMRRHAQLLGDSLYFGKISESLSSWQIMEYNLARKELQNISVHEVNEDVIALSGRGSRIYRINICQ